MKIIKLSSLFFLFFLLIFSLHSTTIELSLNVTSPKDKTITRLTRLNINGTAVKAKEITINKTKVDLEQGGKFNAAALLKPGKNVIDISAVSAGDERATKRTRVLRIVTFDDIEWLYDGKPHWAKSQILTLSTLGIIEGYPDNTFEPDKPITRGELATWLARSKNLKVTTPKEDVFFDVPKEHWRAPYIKAVVDLGIMKGQEYFGIDGPIKRSEAVLVFVRAYGLSVSSALEKVPFVDVSSGSAGASYIYSAYKKGLVIGVAAKKKIFEPDRDIKRAEVAMVISRLDAMRNLRAQLYNFEYGYTPARYCMIGTKPVIKKASIIPEKLKADGKTPVKLSAEIIDAQGKGDISQVWADITSVRGPNNARMDPGETGLYELWFVVSTEVSAGEKDIFINALDKSGLKSAKGVKLTIIGGK